MFIISIYKFNIYISKSYIQAGTWENTCQPAWTTLHFMKSANFVDTAEVDQNALIAKVSTLGWDLIAWSYFKEHY